MSDKPSVMIAAGNWFAKPGTRIGIYNTNYISGFLKAHDHSKPWALASRGGIDLNGERFATHSEAATFVREHLDKIAAQAVS